MDTVISCMSAMTFKWGFVSPVDIAASNRILICLSMVKVHCDPHPGNILVRPHPENPKKPQVVSYFVNAPSGHKLNVITFSLDST